MSERPTHGPSPIPPLASLSAYKVPHHQAPIDLWLHGNEGAPPPAALWRALSDVEVLRRYPSAAALEATLAASLDVPPEAVLVTAGADDALDRVFRAYLASGWGRREIILPEPTFVMLPHYARIVGAGVCSIPWPFEAFPEDAVLAAIGPATRAIALVSPNNPTGAVIAPDAVTRIAHAAPDALVLVDLAYGELADVDLWQTARLLPNALVFRTFSKAWGLAGARVGYVVGRPELLQPLRAVAPPYAVSGPSLAVAAARFATGLEDMHDYCARVRGERQALYDTLVAIGTAPVRSQANFVFTRLGRPARALWLRDALAGLGIGIRAFPAEPAIADGVRITCPADELGMRRLVAALGVALRPDGWAFGRTVAEIGQARAAGLVPVGLGDPHGPGAAALVAAGAARIVSDVDALVEEVT
ncbi:MAG: histidinol-phosphate aminotransferase family protein [Deltaproteobacteria bacterium]|nr:histidinol-phosphate aminotransferase family protein [Deltaproteobacteria bacterium]